MDIKAQSTRSKSNERESKAIEEQKRVAVFSV